MTHVAQQRCFNHAGREAVARCPECRRFFCRECITEHHGRVLCANCLAAHRPTGRDATAAWRRLLTPAEWAAAAAITSAAFYLLGRLLLLLPDSFHDGSLWRNSGL